MPRETGDPLNRGGSYAHRQELVATTEGIGFEADGLRLRFSNVPLFQGTWADLLQGIRMRVVESRIDGVVEVRIGKKAAVQVEVEFNGNRQGSEFLFVPEVVEASDQAIELLLGDHVLGSIAFTVRPQRKRELQLVHNSLLRASKRLGNAPGDARLPMRQIDDYDDVIWTSPDEVAPDEAVISMPNTPVGHNESPSHVRVNETLPVSDSLSIVTVESIASIGSPSSDQFADSVSPAGAFSTSTAA
ncbi:hypothetical protein BH24CHL3_BH24CHL3_07840 [soil metagenome]